MKATPLDNIIFADLYGGAPLHNPLHLSVSKEKHVVTGDAWMDNVISNTVFLPGSTVTAKIRTLPSGCKNVPNGAIKRRYISLKQDKIG